MAVQLELHCWTFCGNPILPPLFHWNLLIDMISCNSLPVIDDFVIGPLHIFLWQVTSSLFHVPFLPFLVDGTHAPSSYPLHPSIPPLPLLHG